MQARLPLARAVDDMLRWTAAQESVLTPSTEPEGQPSATAARETAEPETAAPDGPTCFTGAVFSPTPVAASVFFSPSPLRSRFRDLSTQRFCRRWSRRRRGLRFRPVDVIMDDSWRRGAVPTTGAVRPDRPTAQRKVHRDSAALVSSYRSGFPP